MVGFLLGTSALDFSSLLSSKPKTVHRLWTHSKLEKEKVPNSQVEMVEMNKKVATEKKNVLCQLDILVAEALEELVGVLRQRILAFL